jgi:hypothetical protein
MAEKLTSLQAYKAMLVFLEEYYEQVGRPDGLGGLLGELQCLESGATADPASWGDWVRAVEKVMADDQEKKL